MDLSYAKHLETQEQIRKNAEAFLKNPAQTVISVNGQPVEFAPAPPEIPAEKLQEMKTYARKLMVKNPHWKLSKIQRKTAEYFKVQFSNEKTNPKNSSGPHSGDN